MSIHDYHAGQDVLVNPIDTKEIVEKKTMDKLALALTLAEEFLDNAAPRETLLDMYDDPDVFNFLDRMRKSNRCRYRRYPIG